MWREFHWFIGGQRRVCSRKLVLVWRTHLVSAAFRGCPSSVPAASRCLRLSPSLRKRGTEVEADAEAGFGRRETGAGWRTGFGFSCPGQDLPSSRKLLDRQYLQREKSSFPGWISYIFLTFWGSPQEILCFHFTSSFGSSISSYNINRSPPCSA